MGLCFRESNDAKRKSEQNPTPTPRNLVHPHEQPGREVAGPRAERAILAGDCWLLYNGWSGKRMHVETNGISAGAISGLSPTYGNNRFLG